MIDPFIQTPSSLFISILTYTAFFFFFIKRQLPFFSSSSFFFLLSSLSFCHFFSFLCSCRSTSKPRTLSFFLSFFLSLFLLVFSSFFLLLFFFFFLLAENLSNDRTVDSWYDCGVKRLGTEQIAVMLTSNKGCRPECKHHSGFIREMGNFRPGGSWKRGS